jgi:putative transposase
MRRSKFTSEQISFALKQVEAGVKVSDVCRKLGICNCTFYCWRKKYGCLDSSDMLKLKEMKEENDQLKKLVADLSLDKQMLEYVLKKKC